MKRKLSWRQRDTLAKGLLVVRVFTTIANNLYLNLNRSRMRALINITLSDTYCQDDSSRIATRPPTFSSDESRWYDVIQSSMTSQGVRYESRRSGEDRYADEMRIKRNTGPDSEGRREQDERHGQTMRNRRGKRNFSWPRAGSFIRLLSRITSCYIRHADTQAPPSAPVQSRVTFDRASSDSAR